MMILPTKHLRTESSLIYVGGIVQNTIVGRALSIDQLWYQVKNKYKTETKKDITYDWFILSLNMLYIIGLVDFEKGKIKEADK
jgi:hypothetical protein